MVDRSGRPGKPLQHLPGPPIAAWRRTVRYWLARLVAALLVRALFRLRLEGRDRVPRAPAVICFNHLNWIDPFILMATLPLRPRLFFFGPREEDMTVGGKNRLIAWTASAVPYKPGKNDLLEAARSVRDVFRFGGVLGMAGEGRIHRGEAELLPLNEGVAYFALRNRVPIVPIAINGTSWLAFGRRIRVRVGTPIDAPGPPTRENVGALTERTEQALVGLVQGYPDPPQPGRFGRWLTDVFNEWPEGERPPLDGRERDPRGDPAAPAGG